MQPNGIFIGENLISGGIVIIDTYNKIYNNPHECMIADSGSDSSPELAVNVLATASVDGFAQRLGTTIFARQAKNAGGTAVLAGLRNLEGDVLGLAASGQVTAALPMPLIVAGVPRVDGKVGVRVADWKALSALIPGARLEGEAALSLELLSQQAETAAATAAHTQQATLRWRVPRLLYRRATPRW